jgi:hypothetical protein
MQLRQISHVMPCSVHVLSVICHATSNLCAILSQQYLGSQGTMPSSLRGCMNSSICSLNNFRDERNRRCAARCQRSTRIFSRSSTVQLSSSSHDLITRLFTRTYPKPCPPRTTRSYVANALVTSEGEAVWLNNAACSILCLGSLLCFCTICKSDVIAGCANYVLHLWLLGVSSGRRRPRKINWSSKLRWTMQWQLVPKWDLSTWHACM